MQIVQVQTQSHVNVARRLASQDIFTVAHLLANATHLPLPAVHAARVQQLQAQPLQQLHPIPVTLRKITYAEQIPATVISSPAARRIFTNVQTRPNTAALAHAKSRRSPANPSLATNAWTVLVILLVSALHTLITNVQTRPNTVATVLAQQQLQLQPPYQILRANAAVSCLLAIFRHAN
jgi:hypothetical protein